MSITVSQAERERAEEIVARLHAAYPHARCALNFTSPFELLVATILAAQCQDIRVNHVTATLFQKYQTVEDFANASQEELEQDISSITFYRNKAKNIQNMARMLIADFDGVVPNTMADLLKLPGVARKTANVVLGNAYGIVDGIVVDTHVLRISHRLGMTTSDDPVKVEQDLMPRIDKKEWVVFAHMVAEHGRAVCKAPKPNCTECTLLDLCPTGKDITHTL
jgi:endonuclease III